MHPLSEGVSNPIETEPIINPHRSTERISYLNAPLATGSDVAPSESEPVLRRSDRDRNPTDRLTYGKLGVQGGIHVVASHIATGDVHFWHKYYSIFAEKYSYNIRKSVNQEPRTHAHTTTAPSTFNIKITSTWTEADSPKCAEKRSLFILLNTACMT